jgi:hypothetical protein
LLLLERLCMSAAAEAVNLRFPRQLPLLLLLLLQQLLLCACAAVRLKVLLLLLLRVPLECRELGVAA